MSPKNRSHKRDTEGKDCDNGAEGEHPSVTNSLSGPDNSSCCSLSQVTGTARLTSEILREQEKKIALNFTASL